MFGVDKSHTEKETTSHRKIGSQDATRKGVTTERNKGGIEEKAEVKNRSLVTQFKRYRSL